MQSPRIQNLRGWTMPRVGWRAIAVIAVAAGLLVAAAAFGAGRGGGAHDVATTKPGALPAVGMGGVTAPEEGRSSAGGAVAMSGAIAAQTKDGAPSAAPAPNAGTDLPALDAGRTIIRSGQVDLAVKSVGDAFAQVSQIAAAAGGFVADSTFTGANDQANAYLTIRVPEERFGDVITQLRGLAVDVRSISTSANDVTAEYTDIEATLANLRAVEAQYVELLGRAGSIGDVLQVQDRLNQVRLQIDRTEARRRLLESQSTLSTIAVTLQPAAAAAQPAEPATGPLAAARDAWRASLHTLERIATGVLVVAVYTWWMLPLAAAGAWYARRRWHHATAATAAPSASNGA